MIQQSIKKYEEPAWVSNNNNYNYTGNYNKVSNIELDLAIENAKKQGIKVGQKYKYKSGGSIVTIVGFAATNEGVYHSNNGATVIRGERVSLNSKIATQTFSYSAHELLKAGYMELISE